MAMQTMLFGTGGDGQGLQAWRRLHNEEDPTSSMRRVRILGYVLNINTRDKTEDLGFALEDWLAKKRQHEKFTNRDGDPLSSSR